MKTAKKNIWQKTKEFFVRIYIKNKPINRQDWIRVSILAIAIPVFIYSAGQLGYKLFTYIYEDWRNSQIVDLKPTTEVSPFDSITPSPDEPYQIVYGTDARLNDAGRLPEYEDLWQRNNDMIGWISMPGFTKKPINYPIMYSGDNSYYVYRDFDKKDSYSGSIFMDGSNTSYRIDPTELDYNYVIYGHAMLNRSMFGNITDYFKNETSWKENNKIYIDFMNTRLEYEVFSTFLIDPYYNYRQTHFSSDDEFQKYLDDMVAKSAHDFGIKVDSKDRIITLSTCFQTTRRTAVIAKLVRQIIYVKGAQASGVTITPIALPTYIPLNEPSPTPRVSSSGSSSITSSKPSSSSSSSSSTPGATPTIDPAVSPTGDPGATPTIDPGVTPTEDPSATPTAEPTAVPTEDPGVTPTDEPAATPTEPVV